jgi:hypothetical protein
VGDVENLDVVKGAGSRMLEWTLFRRYGREMKGVESNVCV